METRPISFKELFCYEITDQNNKTTKIDSVVIPKIQRAYAQGRSDDRTRRTRKNFLNAIHTAVSENKQLILDFIYGCNNKTTLIPLDGQQRLTTLFLLHWYAAKKCKVEDNDFHFLRRFSYDTRYSARDFCSQLVDFAPTFETKLSEEIADQAWFPLDWKYDATVESMLVMLDDINEKFKEVQDLWEALDNIKFYFLPIEKMGQTDDIYIKMNSRGKPLTDFEHFKAEFEKALIDIDKELAARIIHKIDIDWTDMLWPYRGMEGKEEKDLTQEDYIIDDEFLRYFRFICDILCYRSNGSPKHNEDEFDLINKYFRGEKARVNVETMERFFDCWKDKQPETIFSRFISNEHEVGKIRLRQNYDKNLFLDCLKKYADVLGNKNRRFTLNQIILLYTFIQYLLNKDKVSEDEFSLRLRIVYNLILNSSDEISDSENRVGGNRMPAILKQVDSIILDGIISDNIVIGDEGGKNNFNVNQLEEERDKLLFTTEHPELAESLFALEDHNLLRGQTGIVGLEHPERFARFWRLFECDWDLVDCALLATGDYWRRDNDWRIQLGSSQIDNAWIDLFGRGLKATGYEQTKHCLAQLLSMEEITNDKLERIAKEYLHRCEQQSEYPWKYYYIKYPSFRVGRYGKYCQRKETPYNIVSIFASQNESQNSLQLFLNELAGEGNAIRETYGHKFRLNDNESVESENQAFVIKDKDGNELKRICIDQENGIDITDRILLGRKALSEYLNNKH